MILITAPVHDIMIETFKKNGLDFEYIPTADYQILFDKIEIATGIVVATQINIDKKILDRALHLNWIARLGSGMEHVDTAYAESKNICCISSPEGNSNAVAEHALGLLLNLVRNISKSNVEIKEMKWLRNENRGMELNGKVAGIIGYGNTGAQFAKILSALGMKVLAYDKYKTGFQTEMIKEASIEEIVHVADVISFHLPLNTETNHFGNKDFFSSLKKKPVIVNTSRGKIVDTAALIVALQQTQIRAAALDVLENEKLKELSEIQHDQLVWLKAQENVLLTPHIAGYTFEAAYKMSKILLEKLEIY
jgi:D-3-phosphoglycerate dehydrogenase / 2-oxoglutarate reductase